MLICTFYADVIAHSSGHQEEHDAVDEGFDMFEDAGKRKEGKARKINRRRSTMRVFQKNEAARRKGGEQNSVRAIFIVYIIHTLQQVYPFTSACV